MTISVAEIYMLAFRKSKVPIIGEAVTHPFDFQIELDSWSWTLLPPESDDERLKRERENAEKAKAKAKAEAAKAKAKDNKSGPDIAALKKKDDDLLKLISSMQKDQRRSQVDRDRAVLEKVRLAQIERRKDIDAAAGDDADTEEQKAPDRFTFTFEKNVDFATAQLLSAMSVGEVLPRIVLTVRHWAHNAPLTFIVTYKDVTLMSYNLTVEPGETMTEIRESWTAKFEMMDYAYQSRPGTGGIPGLTAGTARIFKMNLLKPSKWL